jgi:hypothetical protein
VPSSPDWIRKVKRPVIRSRRKSGREKGRCGIGLIVKRADASDRDYGIARHDSHSETVRMQDANFPQGAKDSPTVIVQRMSDLNARKPRRMDRGSSPFVCLSTPSGARLPVWQS